MIEIRRIGRAHSAWIRLPNEPFPLWGRMVPEYRDGVWSCTAELLPGEERSEMCFPEENYDYDAMGEDCFFPAAFEGERCVGLAVVKRTPFRYLLLDDLKVCAAYRRQGVGRALVEEMKSLAAGEGCRGVYAVAQDNNLSACLFYLACGFRLGGLDTEIYNGTSQEGKHDLYFYLDI